MISKSLIREFETLLGADNVLTDESDRHAFSFDSAVLEQNVLEPVLQTPHVDLLGQVIRL